MKFNWIAFVAALVGIPFLHYATAKLANGVFRLLTWLDRHHGQRATERLLWGLLFLVIAVLMGFVLA